MGFSQSSSRILYLLKFRCNIFLCQTLLCIFNLFGVHLDVMVQPVLEAESPCYIFYRLDTYNIHNNYLWIFMSYTPDFSPVRDYRLSQYSRGGARGGP